MAKPKKQPTGNYGVGYCRPPKHTRWKPGESGNPRGGRKREANLASVLDRALKTRVEICDRKIPKFEIIVGQLVNKAAKGELPAITKVFQLMKECGLKVPEDDKGELTFVIEG